MAVIRGEIGRRWLTYTLANPQQALRTWAHEDQLVPVPSSGTWRVVEAALYPSIDAMCAIRPTDALGPVLASVRQPLAWWLVPADEADDLADLRQLTVHPRGRVLNCPHEGIGSEGRLWLEPPDGSGRLTPVSQLGTAFGPAGVMAR
ncbi:conserved hypothetical protein [Streptomyces sp. SPB78]|uniref:hypothetical protein n=1 Tax=Streptomyces sp. (strain SPB78) TaxID=591157 RepID=UPI0001B54E5B|nr:hypothetical protein [Streptomyces sp. SPB78]EFK99488.1 conserved hypothetical protein [Streptomyces sp. SPB78]